MAFWHDATRDSFHNPDIPEDITTLPPGYPMQMPIYYKPFWGTSFQIIPPDAAFVNGPDAIGFDTKAFLNSTPGWFKHFRGSAAGQMMDADEIIEYYAINYSINPPKLLLALIEYQTGALSNPPSEIKPAKKPFWVFKTNTKACLCKFPTPRICLTIVFIAISTWKSMKCHMKVAG